MKIGDRVRLFPNVTPKFIEQSGGGAGVVRGKISRRCWVDVAWDNGRRNNYPVDDLEVLWDGPLPDPEFDLEEINQGSELYRKLEGR